jgi:phosphoenolpyruvate---glycerone phosphotransferase subunit DhaK
VETFSLLPVPIAASRPWKWPTRAKACLFVVLNHAGDMLTANLTMKAAKAKNIERSRRLSPRKMLQLHLVRMPATVVDSWAVFLCTKSPAGLRFKGKSLEEVAAIAQKFADNMAAISVSLTGATHPVTGGSLAVLNDDEMGVGMGQHGEGGGYKTTDEDLS